MKKGQKMPEALRKAQSERMLRKPLRYWLGKKRTPVSEATRKKLSDAQRRAYAEGRRSVSGVNRQKIASLNLGKTGDLHPKWVEDKKRPFYHAIRTLHEYKVWRKQIFKRDNYTCQLCGVRGGALEADHHPVMFVEIIRQNDLYNMSDVVKCKELWEACGRTLCRSCHKSTFRKPRK